MHKGIQVNTHVGPKAYRQEQGWHHIVPTASAEVRVDAGSILCADTSASSRSVGCAGVMPRGQQVQKITGFSLLKAVYLKSL